MFTIRILIAVLALTCATANAQTEEWTCPSPDQVALLVRAPGWISGDTLNYPGPGRPSLRFSRMRLLAHGPAAVCFYRVDEGGELQFWKFGVCEATKGDWKDSGPNKECISGKPAECALRCLRK